MKRTLLFLVFSLLMALAISACGPQEIVLQFAPEVGEVYQVDTTMNQEMTQFFGGQEITIRQRFDFGYTWEIVDRAETGEITVAVTYNHIATEQTFGDQTLAYDSATDDAPPPALTGMDLLLGRGFQIILTPRGEVREVLGLDAMYQEIVAAADLPADQEAAFAQALQESYSALSFQEGFSNMLVPYDGEPLVEGHEWTIEQQLNGLVPLQITTRYSVQGWDEENATILVSSSLQTDPERLASLGGYQVAYDMTGQQSGQFTVSIANGITREASLQQHLEGSMRLQQGEAALSVPLTIDTELGYWMVRIGE